MIPTTIPTAVCVLLIDPEGRVLSISRGETRASWGLPGGKVEPGESLVDAVVRETYEETGYVVASPVAVYTAYSRGAVNYLTTTFTARIVAAAKDAPRSHPFEGYVGWQPPYVLTQGPFGAYNKALYEHMGLPHDPPE